MGSTGPAGLLPTSECRGRSATSTSLPLVFYVEEQGVWLWGIAEGDWLADDPPVWGRENEPGTSWFQDAQSVSVFLVQMLVMSAALAGPHTANAAWLPEDEAERSWAALGS